MTPEILAAIISGSIPILGGVYAVLKGKRIIGKPPGVDNRADVWHARWGKTCTNAGIVLIVIGSYLAIVSVNQARLATQSQLEGLAWQAVTTEDGRFSAEMPGTPKRKSVDMDDFTVHRSIVLWRRRGVNSTCPRRRT
jgi:hypothetical protein